MNAVRSHIQKCFKVFTKILGVASHQITNHMASGVWGKSRTPLVYLVKAA